MNTTETSYSAYSNTLIDVLNNIFTETTSNMTARITSQIYALSSQFIGLHDLEYTLLNVTCSNASLPVALYYNLAGVKAFSFNVLVAGDLTKSLCIQKCLFPWIQRLHLKLWFKRCRLFITILMSLAKKKHLYGSVNSKSRLVIPQNFTKFS